MKRLISIEVDYHPDTAAVAHTRKVVEFIDNVYGIRSVTVYEDDISN